MRIKDVSVWLYQTSEPLKHRARDTYTKGPFYCIRDHENKVFKYPTVHIFRAIEEYSTTESN